MVNERYISGTRDFCWVRATKWWSLKNHPPSCKNTEKRDKTLQSTELFYSHLAPASVATPMSTKDHILNTPNFVSETLALLVAAAKAKPSTVRVSFGSMMPSSQSLAVLNKDDDWKSYSSRTGFLNASSSSADHFSPRASRLSLWIVDNTPAACSPPITPIRALGHINKNRGEYARPHMP